MEAVLEAKQAGKVRFIGFTGHKDQKLCLAASLVLLIAGGTVLVICVSGIYLALLAQFKHAFKPLIVFAAIPYGIVAR